MFLHLQTETHTAFTHSVTNTHVFTERLIEILLEQLTLYVSVINMVQYKRNVTIFIKKKYSITLSLYYYTSTSINPATPIIELLV